MLVFSVLLFLVIVTVGSVIVGEKTGLPWPALTTLVTTAFVFIPGTPNLVVPPELILPIFLPPLLWALARRTSWAVIRDQWLTVLLLSVVLVVLTMLAVGAFAYVLLPGISFASALVIGAAVAPPDPVAVESVAEPAGIPRRILSTLQSEGLFNDAASIVGFNMALMATMASDEVTPFSVITKFIFSVIAAAVIGLAVARFAAWMVKYVESVPARNVLFWVVPFATYVLAEQVHASGVIAVVVAAIEMNSKAIIEAEDRLASSSFWDTVDVLFTGLAFGMIGLTVNQAVTEVGNNLWNAVFVGIVVSLVAFVVRLAVIYVLYWINKWRHRTHAVPARLQEVLLLTWSGMRGLVTLTLVLSVPYYFTARQEFAIIALTVLLVTMVIPGLFLPILMKFLNVTDSAEVAAEKMRYAVIKRARRAAAHAVRKRYEDVDPDVSAAVQHWIEQELTYRDLLPDISAHRAAGHSDESESSATHAAKVRRIAHTVRREAVQAAQNELLQARNERGMNPMIVDDVLKEIDRLGTIVNREVS